MEIYTRLSKGNNTCAICINLIKTSLSTLLNNKYFQGHLISQLDIIEPYLPVNLCVPHICLYSNLKLVQQAYDSKWMTDKCYDEWMSLNGGDYQLGRGGKLMHLWEDRLSEVEIMDQSHIPKDVIEQVNKSNFIIYNCKYHRSVMHIDLKNSSKMKSDRKSYKILNKLFPFYDDTDKAHSNIDLASLVSTCVVKEYIPGLRHALQYLPIGLPNATAVSMIIHTIGNKECFKIWDLMFKDKMCCASLATYVKYFKSISIAIRRTSLWQDGSHASLSEITGCAYWELAIGRHGRISDWEEERFNRLKCFLPLKLPCISKPSEMTNKEYIDYAYPIMTKIMEQLIPMNLRWPDWSNFCKDRHSWLTSGSAGAKYLEAEGQKIRLNKRSYMETIPISEMVSWLDDEPIIRAIGSEKYEMGKARAIYGTEVKDQAITAYLLTPLEPRLHNIEHIEGSLVGQDEVLSIIRRMNIVKRPKEECTMLDYSDFNRQHTLEMQSLIFKCLKERLIRVGAKADAIKCADWIEKAMLNQWVKFPGSMEFERSVQGMFSGLRSTNFINTILNKVYYQVDLKWVKDNLDVEPVNEFVLHQGDDVWISNKSRLWALTLYKSLQETGLIFSDKKQIQDLNVAEFLRVVYTDQGARGYLGRSVSTLIIRPLQSELDISPTMKAIGVNSQIQTCYRRGLNDAMCSVLWDTMIPFLLKSRIKEISDITIPVNLVVRSFLEGGLDIGKPSTISAKCGSIPPIPVLRYESKFLETNIPKHTSHAYIEIMSEQIQSVFNSERVEDVIHAANISDSIPQGDKIKSLLKFHKQVREWHDKVRKCNVKSGYRIKVEVSEYLKASDLDDGLLMKLRRLNATWENTKICIEEPTELENIFQCITMSPYKDIATAQRARNLNVIEAAKLCIYSSRNKDKIGSAILSVKTLQIRLGNDITSRILSSIRGFGPSMESYFNPIPLSFITNYAINSTVNLAISQNIKNVQQWDKLLNDRLLRSFRTAYSEGTLYQLSNY